MIRYYELTASVFLSAVFIVLLAAFVASEHLHRLVQRTLLNTKLA